MRLLKIGDKKFDLDEKTLVMGILNVTPDSFSDGGLYYSIDKAVEHAKEMQKNGADIIDIGGESSRPGSKPVSIEEELHRVIPVIEQLIGEISIPLSIDTYKSRVAEEAIKLGVGMVNDITALRGDRNMVSIVREYDTTLCIMHMKGTPTTMQRNPYYKDVMGEITSFLEERSRYGIEQGIPRDNIIVDPGIGFGKRTGDGIEDNCTIIRELSRLKKLGFPILVGASRKTFIGNICGDDKPLTVDDRLEGSLAAACIAAMNGADIIRVHDVRETKRALKLVDCIKAYE